MLVLYVLNYFLGFLLIITCTNHPVEAFFVCVITIYNKIFYSTKNVQICYLCKGYKVVDIKGNALSMLVCVLITDSDYGHSFCLSNFSNAIVNCYRQKEFVVFQHC